MFKLKYFKYIIISIFALLLGSCTETTNQVRPTRSQAANNFTPSNPPARGPADTLAPRTNSKEHRLALVIGNNDYQDSYMGKLRNAVNDAKAIRTELTKRDFEVLYHPDATRKQMFNAIDDFIKRLSSNTVAIVFYAGHGMQIEGSNYLLPIDIKAKERDVVDDGINLRKLLNQMGAKQTKFSLAIIDACRNNPLKGHGRSAGARGLTNPRSSTGVVVLYSAGENQQALDRLGNNDPNPNGLFTREFLKSMQEPGLNVREVINKTRTTVYAKAKAVGHEQMPAIYDESVGSFVFTPGMRREEREMQALKARAEAAEQKAKLAAQQNTQDNTPSVPYAPGTVTIYSVNSGPIIYGHGGKSLFTGELLKALRLPNLSLGNVLAITTRKVKEKSNGKHTLFLSGPPDTQLYFDFAKVRSPRLALVIGNNYYQNFPRLAQQAINDAQAIGKEFSKLGFAVTIKTNLTRGDTFAVLNSFVQKIQETTLSKTRGLQGQGLIQVTKPKIVLFYYIGHGIQTRRGNYLIPVDAQIRNEGDLEIDGVNIKHLISKLVEYTSNINILMFDTSNSSALPPPPTR